MLKEQGNTDGCWTTVQGCAEAITGWQKWCNQQCFQVQVCEIAINRKIFRKNLRESSFTAQQTLSHGNLMCESLKARVKVFCEEYVAAAFTVWSPNTKEGIIPPLELCKFQYLGKYCWSDYIFSKELDGVFGFSLSCWQLPASQVVHLDLIIVVSSLDCKSRTVEYLKGQFMFW